MAKKKAKAVPRRQAAPVDEAPKRPSSSPKARAPRTKLTRSWEKTPPKSIRKPAKRAPSRRQAPRLDERAVPTAAPRQGSATSRGAKPAGDWASVLFGGAKVPGVNNGFWKPNSRYEAGAHTGVDFPMPAGTPIHLPAEGVVESVSSSGPYGNRVVVRLPDGNFMSFSHMSKITVSKGQKLGYGAQIGAVGSTGQSSGNHLHLEVLAKSSGGRYTKVKAGWADPINYLNGVKSKGGPVPASGAGSTGGGGATRGGTTGGGGTSGGGTSGGGGGFSKSEMMDLLRQNFGDIDHLLALDEAARNELGGKSIKWAIDEIVKKKIVDPTLMRTVFEKTAWFQKHSEEITGRLVEERKSPGVFATNVEEVKSAILEQYRQAGVDIDPGKLDALARNAYLYGWNDSQIATYVRTNDAYQMRGNTLADLEAALAAKGVSVSIDKLDWLARQVFEEGWSLDQVLSHLKQTDEYELDESAIADLQATLLDKGVHVSADKLNALAVRMFEEDWSVERVLQDLRDTDEYTVDESVGAGLAEALASRGVAVGVGKLDWLSRQVFEEGWTIDEAIAHLKQTGEYTVSEQSKAAIAEDLAALGVKVTPEKLDWLARQGFTQDWGMEQMRQSLIQTRDFTVEGGQIAEGRDALKSFASDHGVSVLDVDDRAAIDGILKGSGLDPAIAAMRERAAQKFLPLADQIRAGQSTKQLTGAYWDVAAQLLEVDPNGISWDDPLFREGKAFITTGEDGKLGMRTLADFRQMVRKDARWRTTKNANEEMSTTGYEILRRFGMVS